MRKGQRGVIEALDDIDNHASGMGLACQAVTEIPLVTGACKAVLGVNAGGIRITVVGGPRVGTSTERNASDLKDVVVLIPRAASRSIE